MLQYSYEDWSYELFWIALCTFLLPLVFRLINFKYQSTNWRRNSFLNNPDKFKINQGEANKICEDPELKVYFLYTNVVRILLYTSLYFAISPGIAILGFKGLVLYFWVEKYNVLKRYLMPSNLRSEIAEAMYEYTDYAIFLVSLGSLISFKIIQFEIELDDATNNLGSALTTFGIIAAFIYSTFPNNRIARSCCAKSNNAYVDCFNQPLLYVQSKDYLQNDYSFANPVAKNPDPNIDFRVKYQETAKHFNCIEILKDCPELLSLFDYAAKYPDVQDIMKGKVEGLQSPYFSFPQNYCYGGGMTHLESIANQKSSNPERAESRHRVSSKDTDINESEIRDRVEVNMRSHRIDSDQSPKISSLMRDINLIKGVKVGDSSDSESKSIDTIGGFSANIYGSYIPPNLESGNSMTGASLMNGISPIVGPKLSGGK
jgi:hypothetical protein